MSRAFLFFDFSLSKKKPRTTFFVNKNLNFHTVRKSPVEIRKDVPIDEIYKKARIEKRAKIRSRMLGIASILEGRKRSEAAKIAGVTINVMRIWVRRFNEQGFDGLEGKKYPGCPPTWTRDHEAFLKDKVTAGAVFERDKRITYRLEDFQAALCEKFGITFGISTIWYKLKKLGLSWITPRQQHPKSNPIAQEEFKKNKRRDTKNSITTS